MFTSKEVLERTGISRATLNNYIGSGLLPRPDVLPPEPSAGSAPRIGYFPDDTVDRILEIQRLKAEGWSIGRIGLHFQQRARGELPAPAGLASASALQPVPDAAGGGAAFFEEIEHPSYGVGAGFELLWSNEASHAGAVARLLAWPAGPLKGRGILQLLLQGGRDADTDDLIGFHLAVARQRGTALADLCRGLAPGQAASIGRRLGEVAPPVPGSVVMARLPAPGAARGLAVHALQLRTGVVFLYAPPALEDAPKPATVTRSIDPAGTAQLAPVAVLATRLQDAQAWWRRLPAQEFLELMADLRATIDPVVDAQGGRTSVGRHASFDAVFVGSPDGSHLPRAVQAGQDLREAMRLLSRRWQVRKGWTAELHLNTGLAEGHDWISDSPLQGEASQQAAALAHAGRDASVWATRALVDRLPAVVLAGLSLAAPVAAPAWVPVDGCFARLRDLVEARGGAAGEVAPQFADLAVAVLAPTAGPGHPIPTTAVPSQDA